MWKAPALERFFSKIEKKLLNYETECWLWTAYKNKCGYGCFRGEDSKHIGGYKGRLAHRWAYEHFVEKIKNGFEIDHICKNVGCVNPEHLRQVTHDRNMEARIGTRVRKAYCKNGHSYTAENVYIRVRGNGRSYRVCRLCKRLNEKRLYNALPQK